MTGAQIRAARGFLDWSVRDLGKKAKVHFNTVHAIERGKSVAKPETLAAIREALEKAGVEFTNGKRPGVRLGVKIEKRLQKARPEAVSFCKFAS
jgi:transcriptional regulator with XRE-family HTH domain